MPSSASSSSSSAASSAASVRFGRLCSPRAPKLITVFLRCPPSAASFGFGLTLEGAGPAKLKVISGGIAHQNGLKSNDELLAIDRESVAELGHLEVVAKMRKVMRRRCEAWLTVRRCPSSSPAARPPSSVPCPLRRMPFHRKWLPLRRSNRYKKCRLLSPPPAFFVQKCADSMVSTSIPTSPISNVSGTSPVLSPLLSPSPHSLVAQWVLEYLGQFGCEQQQKQENCWMEKDETSQWMDKALLFSGRSSEHSELCVLTVFEDELSVHRATAPFVVSVPYGCVRAVGRSRVDSRGFGVLIATADGKGANDSSAVSSASDGPPRPPASFRVLLFRCVPREFAQHHAAHAHFARAMGVQCRRKQLALFELCAFSAPSCVQFPSDCGEVLASLRFGIPPATVKNGNNGTALMVEEIMAKLAEGLEIGDHFDSKAWDGRTENRGGKDYDEGEEAEADDTSTTDSMNTIVEFGTCESQPNQPKDEATGGRKCFAAPPPSSSVSVRLASPRLQPPLSPPIDRFVPLRPNGSAATSLVPSPTKCQTRPMPPPLPPKPHFLTQQQKAPSDSAAFGTSPPFPSPAFSSALSPPADEFVGSDRHKEAAQQRHLSVHLKTTTTTTEGAEAVATSNGPLPEQCPRHNPNERSKVPATAAPAVPSFALSRNSEDKENRQPSPCVVSPEKTKEQTQAEATRESPRRRIGRQIGHGHAAQPQKEQKRQKDASSAASPIGHDQRQSPEAAMPPAPGDGSPKQQHQPDSNVDLEQVLKSEVARAPFHQFLQQQFCAENINFYLAVEEYKKIPENEFGRRTDFGRQIYDRHFAANCIEPVNIDNSTSNQIREAYKNNRFTCDVYDVVQYQIFHLLKYDCWPRYLRAGGQLAEELGGDAKSHDSGASTSQQCLVVGVGNGKHSQPRRKSFFRFLMKAAKTGGTDNASYNGGNDENAEDVCCTCSVAEHRPQHPHNALNGGSVHAMLRRRAHSRSPSQRIGLRRRARRSCAERTATAAASAAAAHAAATLMLRASTASSLMAEDGDAEEHSLTLEKTQRGQRRKCTCHCRTCTKAAEEQFGESKPDFPVRFCTLLCADSATSTEIALSDPFQSVKQWTNAMAEGCGQDKYASEVVDAQTGSTIDPVRQAVDALNNRVVRIIPVVKLPVLFLAPFLPCVGAKPSAPMAAKVVILRCRPALTVGKVLRPIMAKYNVDSEQAVVCIAGTCEVLKLQTPVSAVCLKTLAVMSQQQFAERKVMPKREYQKELTMVPSWMISVSTATPTAASSTTSPTGGQSSPGPDSHLPPFHQHGDVGFCELPLEAEGSSKLGSALLKHTATRSYSSNPREFFKFGRKPTMAKSRAGLEQQQTDAVTGGAAGPSVADSAPGPSGGGVSQLRYRKSGGSGMGPGRSGAAVKDAESRRKSLGAAAAANAVAAGAVLHRDSPVGTPTGSVTGVSSSGRLSSAALAVGLVAPSDIPYCGEAEPPEEPPLEQETCSTYAVHSTLIRHEPVFGTKSAVVCASIADRKGAFGSEDFSRNRPFFPSGANGATVSAASPLPAIFSSAVRSDKNGTGGAINASPSTEAMVWQKADFV